MYYDFRDFICDAFKITLALVLIILLCGLSIYLLNTNINFAYYISDKLEIPRDLSLTVMSAGFANNIIILMSVFEFGLGIWLVNKLMKTTVYDNVKNFIINL